MTRKSQCQLLFSNMVVLTSGQEDERPRASEPRLAKGKSLNLGNLNHIYRQVPNGAPPGHYLDIFNCSS